MQEVVTRNVGDLHCRRCVLSCAPEGRVIGRLLRRTVLPIALVASAIMLACGGGSSESPGWEPLLSSGTLDPGFGSGGKVITEFGGDALAKAVAIQADGRSC